MKTTLNIPDELMEKARHAAGRRTKTETVIVALEELIRQKKTQSVLGKAGKLDFVDWEEARHAR